MVSVTLTGSSDTNDTRAHGLFDTANVVPSEVM